MKTTFVLILASCLAFTLCSCKHEVNSTFKKSSETAIDSIFMKKEIGLINQMLDSFNLAAAQANYDVYFNFFDNDAVFAGTDATEYWTKSEFMLWAKPHFDRKKTWNFTSIERHIYFNSDGSMAWFDELLDTRMKICRGSGVVIKLANKWKIKQYILSMTIPNAHSSSVIELKTTIEDSILELKTRRIIN